MTDAELAETSSQFQKLYKKYLALPAELIGEIIDGHLYTQDRPGQQHSAVVLALLSRIYPAYHQKKRGPGGWYITYEPNLRLSFPGEDPNLIHPDVLGWLRADLPGGTLIHETTITTPPIWVCEVLSPGTKYYDRYIKRQKYAKHGVQDLWLIDPEEKSVETFMLKAGQLLEFQSFQGTGKVRIEPFDQIRIDLAELWQE